MKTWLFLGMVCCAMLGACLVPAGPLAAQTVIHLSGPPPDPNDKWAWQALGANRDAPGADIPLANWDDPLNPGIKADCRGHMNRPCSFLEWTHLNCITKLQADPHFAPLTRHFPLFLADVTIAQLTDKSLLSKAEAALVKDYDQQLEDCTAPIISDTARWSAELAAAYSTARADRRSAWADLVLKKITWGGFAKRWQEILSRTETQEALATQKLKAERLAANKQKYADAYHAWEVQKAGFEAQNAENARASQQAQQTELMQQQIKQQRDREYDREMEKVYNPPPPAPAPAPVCNTTVNGRNTTTVCY
jgi:hypothetical protein